MCGKATLAIVLSTPCMIVANMIEAVIIPRFVTAPRAPLLTCLSIRKKHYRQLTISLGDEFCKTSMGAQLVAGNSIAPIRLCRGSLYLLRCEPCPPFGSFLLTEPFCALRTITRRRTRPIMSARKSNNAGLNATAATISQDCVAPVGRLSSQYCPRSELHKTKAVQLEASNK